MTDKKSVRVKKVDIVVFFDGNSYAGGRWQVLSRSDGHDECYTKRDAVKSAREMASCHRENEKNGECAKPCQVRIHVFPEPKMRLARVIRVR